MQEMSLFKFVYIKEGTWQSDCLIKTDDLIQFPQNTCQTQCTRHFNMYVVHVEKEQEHQNDFTKESILIAWKWT